MSNDIDAVAIVHYKLASKVKGTYELPAETLDEAMEETRAMFARNVAEGEEEYAAAEIFMQARWGVPSNWIGV